MKVLVDTSIWSLALRRKHVSVESKNLTDLILTSQLVMIGPVRQELLSGISDKGIFSRLKLKLEPFEDMAITTKDYETAAQYFNICRSRGVQGSHIDFLICTVAANNNLLIYTSDQDFGHFAKYLPIRLYDCHG